MTTGRVYVNPQGKTRGVPKDLRDFLAGITVVAVEDPRMWRTDIGGAYVFDYYITRVTANRASDLAAIRTRATLVHLPRQGYWLAGQIEDIIATGRDVWIYQPDKLGDCP